MNVAVDGDEDLDAENQDQKSGEPALPRSGAVDPAERFEPGHLGLLGYWRIVKHFVS